MQGLAFAAVRCSTAGQASPNPGVVGLEPGNTQDESLAGITMFKSFAAFKTAITRTFAAFPAQEPFVSCEPLAATLSKDGQLPTYLRQTNRSWAACSGQAATWAAAAEVASTAAAVAG
jgi:hypothetical protein